MLPSESSLPIARRATWRDTECLELVCGIANAGGGRLILDADVDSRGAVKRRTSRLMKTIPGLIAQSLNLTCAVELVLDSGRFCLEVVIPPANDPISFRGIFFFYKDGENNILDDEALDRLCIDNVGRPPRTWTVGALLGRHTSRPNNPNLVAALRSLGIIDGWGNGVSRIRMSCMEAGTPEPIFELRDDETMVCFPMDSDSLLTASITHANAINAAPVARADLPEVQQTARARATQQDTSLTLNDEKVLAMLDIDGRLTAPRIAKNLNISESTVRRSFRRLRDLGLIDRVGSDKSGFWQVQ